MRVRSLFKSSNILPLALLVVAAILPHFLNPYYVHVAIYTLWFIYLCVAWNILANCGQESICHPLFISAGAYTSTMLFLKLGVSPLLGIWAGVVAALLVALIVGFLNFPRGLPPFTFALITLALNFIGLYVVMSGYGWLRFLGSTDGFHILFSSTQWQNFLFMGKLPYYYIILGMVVGVLIAYQFIQRSRWGLRFRAIRDNERAAAAVGIDLVHHKFIGLLISAGLAALAGTFWAQYTAFVTPATVLAPLLGILIILFVYVGGLGTLWGPVLAPAILVPLGEILRAEVGSQLPGLNLVIYGVIIVAVIIIMPRGVIGWFRERRARSSPS